MGNSLTEAKAAFEGGATRSEQQERYELISPYGMRAMARRLALGAKKHGERNWERGQEEFRQATISHLMAHLLDYMLNGDALDSNTDAIICNAMFLCHFEAKRPYQPHQCTKEESTTCPGNANGAVKRSGNDPRDSAASHVRSTTEPSTSATPEPAHLPQPDGCSIPLESSTAPAAPGPASASAEDQLELSRVAMDILQKLDAAHPRNLWWHEVVDGRCAQKVVVRLEHLNLIASKGHSLHITELGRASLCASRIAEGRRA